MKGLLILIVVIAIALFAAIKFGGFTSMDPAEQARQFVETVKPGMTWQQVADFKTPRKYYPIDYTTINGERQPVDFDPDTFASVISAGHVADGFIFKYQFTDADAFQVVFDNQGTVVSVDDVMTARDLMEGKAFHQ